MTKLLTILLAGTVAAGAALAQGASATIDATGGTSGSSMTRPSGSEPALGGVRPGAASSGAAAIGSGTTSSGAFGGSTSGAAASNTTNIFVPGTGTQSSTTAGARSMGAMGASGDSTFCPPGLEKKDNGCLPPGQARKSGALNKPTDPTTLNRR